MHKLWIDLQADGYWKPFANVFIGILLYSLLRPGTQASIIAADQPVEGRDTVLPSSPSSIQLPLAVDLRPKFARWELPPRQQGRRPTCSVFTVVGALEYAVASKEGNGIRLSVEFLNWAANQATRQTKDGGFFSDLWKGFAGYGICAEDDMPYRTKFDPAQGPNATAIEHGQAKLALKLRQHWIKKWDVNTGLTAEHLATIKRTLHQGWPVCGGFRWPKQEKWDQDILQMCHQDAVRDGHSVLIVGYLDVEGQAGGGVFIFRNTGGNGKDGHMPYAYAQAYMNDAIWIDYEGAPNIQTTPIFSNSAGKEIKMPGK